MGALPLPPVALPDVSGRRHAFVELRAAHDRQHRAAAAPAFVPATAGLLATGFSALDAALGGGVPRGCIATLEGPSGCGGSALAARLLARATGLNALIERPDDPAGGRLLPLALAAAGIDLERLLVVAADDEIGAARALDILLHAALGEVIVVPALRLNAANWTRIANLAHRSGIVVLVRGANLAHELRAFAALRLGLRTAAVYWTGESGLFTTLAGIEVGVEILKHKRAVPGKTANFICTAFDRGGAPLELPATHRRVDAARLRVRSCV
ncbi:MAG: hypothetical protein ACREM6_14070 [Vulcanimicrobiaceae bacterium]